MLKKIENIVREEMDASGAQEILMPVLQPAELWEESGRLNDYGPELMRLVDRHNREMCLGPTHEEIIVALVRNELRSYKELPQNLYQIQTKYRDEIRPRFGLLRSREFVMKDAYSFNATQESLQETYDEMGRAYGAICERCGLGLPRGGGRWRSDRWQGDHRIHGAGGIGRGRPWCTAPAAMRPMPRQARVWPVPRSTRSRPWRRSPPPACTPSPSWLSS